MPIPPINSKGLKAPKLPVLAGKTQNIVPEKWNKVYPYRFRILEVAGGANYGSVNASATSPKNFQDKKWGNKFSRTELELNIPPSSYSMSLQFTSVITATNSGIVEENNGIVFRTIQLSGTTGLWPERSNVADKSAPSNSSVVNDIKRIFPAAINAIKEVKSKFDTLVGNKDGSSKDDLNPFELQNTGYYQFWLLHNFFVEYAEAKSHNNGNEIRLVFDNIKDNQSYVVTPLSFDLQRDASNPLLYRYSISLKAWDIPTADERVPSRLLPGINQSKRLTVASALNKIRQARSAITSASNVVRAAQGDVNQVIQTMNQAVLFCKDVVGVDTSLWDFFPTIRNNFDQTVIPAHQALKAELEKKGATDILPKLNIAYFAAIQAGAAAALAIGAAPIIATTPLSMAGINYLGSQLNGGLEMKNASPSGESSSTEGGGAELVKLTLDALSQEEISDSISIDNVIFPASVQKEMDDQVEAASNTSATEISSLAEKLRELNDNLAYASGGMDETYAKAYNLPAPTETRALTEDDIILSASIELGREGLLETLARGDIYKEGGLDPFVFANGALANSEQLETPLSAFPVPVPKGSTLDDIAQQYLGDPTRAKEIAILNSLRAPYIDETGFYRQISQIGARSFIVADRTNLVINQTITITAENFRATRRHILSIETLSHQAHKITVDGPSNLNVIATAAEARLHARIPGTIGSGDMILIPSDAAPDSSNERRATPITERLTYTEKTFEVDLAIDSSGDLIIDHGDDLTLSYGYKNAVQAVMLKLQTEQGELGLHLDYGINAQVGQRLTTELYEDIAESVRQAILSDTRFSEAFVEVQLEGTALKVKIDIVAAGGVGRIPVQFEIDL